MNCPSQQFNRGRSFVNRHIPYFKIKKTNKQKKQGHAMITFHTIVMTFMCTSLYNKPWTILS